MRACSVSSMYYTYTLPPSSFYKMSYLHGPRETMLFCGAKPRFRSSNAHASVALVTGVWSEYDCRVSIFLKFYFLFYGEIILFFIFRKLSKFDSISNENSKFHNRIFFSLVRGSCVENLLRKHDSIPKGATPLLCE